jgi:FMN reductase
LSFVILVGNPKPASRTLAVATAAAGAILRAAGLTGIPQTIDICVLARHLLLPEPSPAVEEALDQVAGADLLLVASPTYKGTYTGLLKVFLDRLDYQALSSVVALPLLVMRVPNHALAVDLHLRPLLLELGASTPAPGLAFLEPDLAEPGPVLDGWADRVATALGRCAALAAADRPTPDSATTTIPGRSPATILAT